MLPIHHRNDRPITPLQRALRALELISGGVVEGGGVDAEGCGAGGGGEGAVEDLGVGLREGESYGLRGGMRLVLVRDVEATGEV